MNCKRPDRVMSASRALSPDQHTAPDLEVADPPAVFAAHGDRLSFIQPCVVLVREVKEALDLDRGLLVAAVQDDEGRAAKALAAPLHDARDFQVFALVLPVGRGGVVLELL